MSLPVKRTSILETSSEFVMRSCVSHSLGEMMEDELLLWLLEGAICKALKKDDELNGEYLCETIGIDLCIIFAKRRSQFSIFNSLKNERKSL